MNTMQLYENIHSYCISNADKKVVQKYSKYFTEGYDAYGLSRETFDGKAKELTEESGLSQKLALSVSKPLIKSGKYEETSFAIRLLSHFSDQFDKKTFNEIEKWFAMGINNWAHCDVLCSLLITPLFERKVISLEDISTWRGAENKYQRRSVPVSMLAFLKTSKNYKALFAFIDPIMTDQEKKVQQGLGWFLREAWKIKPEPTETFLLKWKDCASRTIFQYATEKMTPEEKKRFKKAK